MAGCGTRPYLVSPNESADKRVQQDYVVAETEVAGHGEQQGCNAVKLWKKLLQPT